MVLSTVKCERYQAIKKRQLPENAHVGCKLGHRQDESVGGPQKVPGAGQLVRENQQEDHEEAEERHRLQHGDCPFPIQAVA
jgi:hypothetical protein